MTSETGRPPSTWPLTAAAWLAAAEGIGLTALAVSRDTPPLRLAFILLKLAFCVAVVGRRAGAWLALLLYEVASLLFALVATGEPLAARLAVAGTAATVLVLLGRSARLFPSPTLPRS